VAILGLLIGLLLPALARSRETSRAAACLSNLRQAWLACRAYADENRGFGPAIGEPYAAPPNWGLVVQRFAGEEGRSPGELFRHRSVLVCPTAKREYGVPMTRTYAMNATGHAGLPGDPDNYDDPARPAFVRLDRAAAADSGPLLMDSARTTLVGSGPPAQRTASTLDFRQPAHAEARLGRRHGRTGQFQAAFMDGSARAAGEVLDTWRRPLP
jgi:hypothetical protein